MTETRQLIEQIQTLAVENDNLLRQLNVVVSSNQFLIDENKKSYKRENIYSGVIVALILIISVIISVWIVI